MTRMEKAEAFIKSKLNDDDQREDNITYAARGKGISLATLFRAKTNLGVQTMRLKEGIYWTLEKEQIDGAIDSALIGAIVKVIDKHSGGQHSHKARSLFSDITEACYQSGHKKLADIMKDISYHYDSHQPEEY